MPNSDTKYGVHNKRTHILSQIDDGSTALTTFANVDAAKSHFYTAEALTVFDECCTQLQWSLLNDGNGDVTKLKYTMAFGSKGGNIAAADDWAGLYSSRQTTLINASGWGNLGHTTATSTDHLF